MQLIGGKFMTTENTQEKTCEQKETNLLLVRVEYLEDEISVKSTYEYQAIHAFKGYNEIRFAIFNHLKEEFIDPVINKGLQKEEQKQLFKENYNEFIRFLERKIRYWLAEFLNSKELRKVVVSYNNHLVQELEYNYLATREQMAKPDITKLTKISNDYLQHALVTSFPKRISSYILSKNKYKEHLLGFFNEFLKYLIIF